MKNTWRQSSQQKPNLQVNQYCSPNYKAEASKLSPKMNFDKQINHSKQSLTPNNQEALHFNLDKNLGNSHKKNNTELGLLMSDKVEKLKNYLARPLNESLNNNIPQKAQIPQLQIGKTHEEIIQEYEKIYQICDQLFKTNQFLEHSLAQETLNSEEQRVYISILKKTIETEIQKNGIFQYFKTKQRDKNVVDIFLEFIDLKNQVEEKTLLISQVNQDNQQMASQQNELIQKNQQQQIKIQTDEQQQNQLQNQLNEIKEQLNNSFQQNEDYQSQIMNLSKENQQMEIQIKNKDEEIATKAKKIDEMMNQQKALLNSNFEQSEQLKISENEIKKLQKENQSIQNSNSALIQESNLKTQKFEQMQQINENNSQQYEYKLTEKNQEIETLIKENLVLKTMEKQLVNENFQFKEENGLLTEELNEKTSYLNYVSQQTNEQEQQLRMKSHNYQELENLQQMKTRENDRLKQELNSLNNNLNSLQSQNYQMKQELSNLNYSQNIDYQKISQELQEIRKDLDKQKMLNGQLNHEKEEALKEIQQLLSFIKKQNDNITEYSKEIQQQKQQQNYNENQNFEKIQKLQSEYENKIIQLQMIVDNQQRQLTQVEKMKENLIEDFKHLEQTNYNLSSQIQQNQNNQISQELFDWILNQLQLFIQELKCSQQNDCIFNKKLFDYTMNVNSKYPHYQKFQQLFQILQEQLIQFLAIKKQQLSTQINNDIYYELHTYILIKFKQLYHPTSQQMQLIDKLIEFKKKNLKVEITTERSKYFQTNNNEFNKKQLAYLEEELVNEAERILARETYIRQLENENFKLKHSTNLKNFEVQY